MKTKKPVKFTGVRMFTAAWCGPCKQAKPSMKRLEAKGVKVEYIDADDAKNTGKCRGLAGLPTFKLIKNGRMIPREKYVGWPHDVSDWPKTLGL